MIQSHVNRIATAVPPHEVHATFVRFAESMLEGPARALFTRMSRKSGISKRYSVLAPATDGPGDAVDGDGFYRRGAFPSTGERMKLFERHAPALAEKAVDALDLGFVERSRITHLVVTTCTGAYAPGLDLELAARLGLAPTVERTMVGFMGCYAAVNALKLAHHFVRSEPRARVLVVSLELCTLHLRETAALEPLLASLLFADGCAACLVTADRSGLALDGFHAEVLPSTADLVTWHVRDQGFDMHLGGEVPRAIASGLADAKDRITGGRDRSEIRHWAVHPGGRTVLEAVERGLELPESALAPSRAVLDRYGNMSSATVLFVLGEILRRASPGDRGCGMSFGPGLSAETFVFHKV